jgi:hypothetical protein
MNNTPIPLSVFEKAVASLLEKAAKQTKKKLTSADVRASYESLPLKEAHSHFPTFYKVWIVISEPNEMKFFALYTCKGQEIEIY